jgi:hypothetical protein
MSRTLFAIVVVLATTLPSPADDTYTIQWYNWKEGDVLKVTTTVKSIQSMKYDSGRRKVTDEQEQDHEVSYTEEILSKLADAPRIAKFRRTYHTWSDTGVDGEKTVHPLVGKTVEVDRTGKKQVITVGGKPPTDDLAEALETEFAAEESLEDAANQLPAKPVKVGDTWPLDKKTALAEVKKVIFKGMELNEEKGTYTGKLVMAEKKNGAVYGTIEFTHMVPVKKYPVNDDMTVDVEAGSVVTMKETLTKRLDGSEPGSKSTMTLSIAVKAKLPDSKLEVKTTITGSETQELVPKAKK